MGNRKRTVIVIVVLALLVLSGIVYFMLTKEDKETTLNILEKQWIESNKNKIRDFGFVNDIAILNNPQDSLIFHFMEDLEKTTGLEFNKVSYKYSDDIKEEYSFRVTKELDEKDILIYSDNYILVGKQNIKYNDLSEIKKGTIAVLNTNIQEVSKYLNNSDLNYVSLDSNYLDLLKDFNKKDSSYDYIVIPRLVFLGYYDEYDNLFINYHITELQDNYVIRLGDAGRLNDILTKYYNKWKTENYEKEFYKNFASIYYKLSETKEKARVSFKSKRYTYGFVENAPFDIELNGKLYGINSSLLKAFSKYSGSEIIFKSYPTVKKLQDAFNKNEIDIMFDKYSARKYDVDTYNTVSMFDEEVVLISPSDYAITINSLNSLENSVVATLKNTKISEVLKTKCGGIKNYDSVSKLLNYNGIIAIDLVTYNFYKNTAFKNFKTDYLFNLGDEYTYLVRDIKGNEVFENFLNFYLSYINEDLFIQEGYQESYDAVASKNKFKALIYSIVGFLVLIGTFFLGSILMPKQKDGIKKKSMKKVDKLKYIDMLTSLKNRNYLNDNIEFWDESEIYPQAIIIIDLNNVAYINDNYGHQEGDNVIKEAANRLINNQISNTEVIRTNGNEFLIYMVGYEEKQVVAYIKKITKEFKDLPHGFGAAFGYSMITDGIKTIDDAVNEATLDMRSNKEELSD